MKTRILVIRLLVAACGISGARGATYYVPNQYASIQNAIRSVPDGSTIVVASGTYTEFMDLFALNKNILISSSGGSGVTFIDGGGTRKLLQLNNQEGDPNKYLTFDGFTFRNGYASGDASPVAIVDAKPVFQNCIFFNNRAGDRGGALRILGGGSNPYFLNCSFISNQVDQTGGGAVLVNAGSAQATFQQCLFQGNSALTPASLNFNHGGAIYFAQAGGRIISCTFKDNRASYTSGGIIVFSPLTSPRESVTITDSIFDGNIAERNPLNPPPADGAPTEGGAIHAEDNVQVTIAGCLFKNNRAMSGGAVNTYRGRLIITNCVFDGNVAVGGIAPSGAPVGVGGAIGCNSYTGGYLRIENTIVRNCRAPVGGGIAYGDNGSYGTGNGSRCKADFLNVVIENCVATTVNGQGNGGAFNFFHSDITGDRVYILNNHAEYLGGGIVMDGNTRMSLNNAFIVGNSAQAGTSDADSIHVWFSPQPSLTNTVVAYNAGDHTAATAGFIAAPPVLVAGNAYLAYVVAPYDNGHPPMIHPSGIALPDLGGYTAGSVVISNVAADTVYSLSSQYGTQQVTVVRSPYRQRPVVYPGKPVVGNFDDDGYADYGVYYAPLGDWKLQRSTNGYVNVQFGYGGTIPLVGDFDGDQQDDIGCYFPPYGAWYIFQSTKGFKTVNFGYDGTVPVVGDFDGDTNDDIGCYYAPLGAWYIFQSTKGFKTVNFGYDGTVPVVGDFDGDGNDDIGCYYAPLGAWYIFQSTKGFKTVNFGYDGTAPVVGDFDGDHQDDIGCYHPSSGNWYIFMSAKGFTNVQFGFDGTLPVVADFDGDHQDDIGCYSPPSGEWFVFMSTDGFTNLPPVGSQF